MVERSQFRRIDARRTRQRGWRTFALGLVFGFGLADAAFAEDEQEADPRSGFAVFIEAAPQVNVQRVRGSVDTNFGSNSRKSNVLTNMTFRLGGGAKGPEIEALWGRPRPVAYAAALVPLNESSTIGALLVKTTPPGFENVQTAKYSVEYQTSATAGLGLEFMVPVLDIEIGVTPAIESLHLASRYVGEDTFTVVGIGRPDLNEDHALRRKKDITQHFLGPALRLSTPTAVIGGFAIDFFFHSSVLFDVAGTRREFFVQGANGDRGSFNFEAGTGIVQVTSGLQVRWP